MNTKGERRLVCGQARPSQKTIHSIFVTQLQFTGICRINGKAHHWMLQQLQPWPTSRLCKAQDIRDGDTSVS